MSKLLINDKPLMVLPKLAVEIGLNQALVLQQVHYWILTFKEANKRDHYHDGEWWVYNTKREWGESFPWWSESTVWRALTDLRERGLLIVSSKYNRKGYDRTLWYRIDYEALSQIEKSIYSKWENGTSQNDKMDVVKMTSPIPETITETITETTTQKKRHHHSGGSTNGHHRRILDIYHRIIGQTAPSVSMGDIDDLWQRCNDYTRWEEVFEIAAKKAKGDPWRYSVKVLRNKLAAEERQRERDNESTDEAALKAFERKTV